MDHRSSTHPEGEDQETTSYPMQTLIKLPTHIAGLDHVLRGGIPKGAMTILSGGPGSGKTMIALEILYHNARQGVPGLLVSFEEKVEVIRGNARSMGWGLTELEAAGRIRLIHPQIDSHSITAGDFSIKGLLAVLEGKAGEIGAEFIVIDSLDVLLRLFRDPRRQEDECLNLNHWLITRGLTTLLTVKVAQSFRKTEQYGFLDYLASCVISLDQRVTGHIMNRYLLILKYRGSEFNSSEHPFIISEEGLVLMPISYATLDHKRLGSMVSTGNDHVDTIMGGGYRRGAAILVSGPTGSGKTTFASLFARAACERGERVQYVSFEESPATLLQSMSGMDIDLEPYAKAGTLKFLTPSSKVIGLEEHLYRMIKSIEKFRPDHHILDAVSAARRMGSRSAALDFMVRLLDACKKRSILSLCTNQVGQGTTADKFSGLGISSLIDTAMVLNYSWLHNEFARSVLVLKSRGARHSHKIHQFRLTPRGIRFGDPDRLINTAGGGS